MNATQNRLIALLPRKDRLHFIASCVPVQLLLGQVLCEPGNATRFAYFPVDSFISLLTQIVGKPALEVGMVGREGMLGAELGLGVATTPLHAVVQGERSAWRINRVAFRRELAGSAALQQSMHRYLYVLMSQLTSSAACLRFHLIGPRLARWLLMSQDRAHCDRFRAAHEFLAYMLGVRRVGITAAAGQLQRSGLIEYRRGNLTVLNRKGLEAAACSCFATDKKSYQHFLG